MTFSGNDGEVGSRAEFEGNSDVGAGNLEILALTPNQQVDMKLVMTKPIHGENLIVFRICGKSTKFAPDLSRRIWRDIQRWPNTETKFLFAKGDTAKCL